MKVSCLDQFLAAVPVEETRKIDQIRTLMDILTPRQFSVAVLVAWGLKNSEIAARLGTTEYMVKNYMKEIYDRAGCWNRVELALRFVYENHAGLYDSERLNTLVNELESAKREEKSN